MNPKFTFTPLLAVKIMGSFIVSVLGMYYLNVGQKEKDIGAMIKGAALVMLSLLFFL